MTQLLRVKRTLFINPLVLLLATVTLLLQSFTTDEKGTPLVLLNAKPKAGEKITLRYNPAGTPLEGKTDFQAYAYLFDHCDCLHPQPTVHKITLQKGKDGYEGAIPTTAATKAVVVKFQKDDAVDNNSDKGYIIPLYDKSGKVVPGAHAYMAQIAGGSFGFATGVKSNSGEVARYAEEEFKLYPASKKQYVWEYVGMLLKSGTMEDKETVRTILADIAKDPKSDEAKLQNVQTYYVRLKDKEKEEEIKSLIKQRFPQGDWVRAEKMTAFSKEKDIEKKVALYNEILQAYPAKTETDKTRIDNMTASIAQTYANSGDYAKMEEYLGKVSSPLTKANVYNSVAWKLVGNGLEGEAKDLESAQKLSAKSRELVQQSMTTGAGKPGYLTNEEWADRMKGQLNMFTDTYALIRYKAGDAQGAYELQAGVVEGTKRKSSGMNELFALYTEKVKGADAAQKELESFFTTGAYTAKMKTQLKNLYLANHTEEQWNQYIGGLEQLATAAKVKELKEKLVNKPAPTFALKDLTGKEVALKDLKGKVVIVDFWATWCGPCIASFPGMQKMVDKYKDDSQVAFLFIDTWENIDNREQAVKDFVAKNNYTFQVLYDVNKPKADGEYQVVSDYDVSGIPTKFVLDPNGKIAFKSVGYNSNLEDMMKELDLMIDIAKAN